MANLRTEYHVRGDELLQVLARRPPRIKQWRFDLGQSSLVGVIEEGTDGSFSFHDGLAATPERITEAIRRYLGVFVDDSAPDFGDAVPSELRAGVASHVQTAVADLTRQISSFAEETDLTGYLKGVLHSPTSFEFGGWRASIRTWTYSRRPKERDLGADIGVIVEIVRDGVRVLKALWFQAKKTEQVPNASADVPDLPGQIKAMRRQTTEAYTLLYTSEGVQVCHSDKFDDMMTLSGVIVDGIICRRGDRTPRVVALTAHAKLMLDVLIVRSSESGEVAPLPSKTSEVQSRVRRPVGAKTSGAAASRSRQRAAAYEITKPAKQVQLARARR